VTEPVKNLHLFTLNFFFLKVDRKRKREKEVYDKQHDPCFKLKPGTLQYCGMCCYHLGPKIPLVPSVRANICLLLWL